MTPDPHRSGTDPAASDPAASDPAASSSTSGSLAAVTVAPALAVAAIVLLAINLRPVAVSVGPVLDDIRSGLGMNNAEAGVLTSLPVLAFAGFGALAPRLGARFGAHRLSFVALLLVVVGLWGRSRVPDVPSFLLLTLLALAGMACANVLLPSLVKLHFPHHIGAMTAVYSTAMAVGLTAASVLTVPIAQAGGGWRDGLAVWSLTALIGAVPWLGLLRAEHRTAGPRPAISMREVARTRTGRRMALFFGLQSLQAYSIFGWFAQVYADAGFSARTAGVLLGVITAVSIPLSIVVPTLAGRTTNQSKLTWTLMLCYPVGYLGLAVAPHAGAWIWALLVGVAATTFPLVLTMISLRARTPEGTAALSGFTQGAGYLIAALGPFGVGVLHGLSGGWVVPLLVLTAISVPQLVFGLLVSRPAYVEDELPGAAGR